MNKEKELQKAIIKLKREADTQNLIIEEISLPEYWIKPTEIPPEKMLGIKIK